MNTHKELNYIYSKKIEDLSGVGPLGGPPTSTTLRANPKLGTRDDIYSSNTLNYCVFPLEECVNLLLKYYHTV